MTADLIIKGKIFTSEEDQLFAQAVAVKDGIILAVGDESEVAKYCGINTKIEYAKGLVVPGIVEGHAHVSCAVEFTKGVLLTQHADNYNVYLEDIKEYWNQHPDIEVITGSGYDNGAFDSIGPTAEILDTITKDIPIVLIASDHHSRWLNSAAMALTGIDDNTPNPDSGEIVRYPNGKATGWLKESAGCYTAHIIPQNTADDYAQAIEYYQSIAVSNGVTAVFEPMFDAKKDYTVRAEGWKIAEKENRLKMLARIGYSLEADDDVDLAFGKMKIISDIFAECEKVKLSTVKFFIDGVIECHTAYLLDDYKDRLNDRGQPTCTQQWLDENAIRALSLGYDLHAHVIGDGAVEMALSSYVKAQNSEKVKDNKNFRNVLTHLQIVNQQQMDIMAENRILAVTNPYWHSRNPMYFNQVEIPFLGVDRAEKEYPMKSLAIRNISISQASDFPVTFPPTSMDSLHFMVNRAEPNTTDCLNVEECLDITTALRIMTIGGAYQLRLEDQIGSIKVGKKADFAFIDKDPYVLQAGELYTCKIEKTFINGICVYNI